MAPDVDATAGTPKGWYDLEAVLAEKPVAALLATYLAHDAGRRAEAAHLAAHAEAFCLRVRQGLEQADFGRKRELLELLARPAGPARQPGLRSRRAPVGHAAGERGQRRARPVRHP